MNSPLLSVVIATKNREIYCIAAIESILSMSTDIIQITISDNSESEILKQYLEANPNDRIVYRYDNTEISSIENFNRAMELATGEYVCLIGDDDTILPEIVSAVNWAKKNNIDSLCSNNYLHYYWPGALKDNSGGVLIIPNIEPKVFKVDVKTELTQLIRNGIVNYVFFSLPKTYHGIVKREIMQNIKDNTGHFYGGLSPDIYSVIAVSCLSKDHYATTVPLTIAGVCATSTTADNITGKHSGELTDMPHLKNRGPYVWDKKIPAYYSVSTIWAESGLKALSELGQTGLYNCFNRYPLIAQGILMNRNYIFALAIKKTIHLQKSERIPKLIFWLKIIWAVFILLIDKVKRVYQLKFSKKNKKIEDVLNIKKALSIIAAHGPYKEGIDFEKLNG